MENHNTNVNLFFLKNSAKIWQLQWVTAPKLKNLEWCHYSRLKELFKGFYLGIYILVLSWEKASNLIKWKSVFFVLSCKWRIEWNCALSREKRKCLFVVQICLKWLCFNLFINFRFQFLQIISLYLPYWQ